VALIAVITAGAVVSVGAGEAVWLCVPAVLLACASSRTRRGAALSGATVIASAAAPFAVSTHVGAFPSPLLLLFVCTASVVVLVSARERLERERDAMRDYALSDPLTGVANRRLLLAHAEYEIARHRRGRRCFAVVMLDLDGFKLVNDRFGHAAGDDLLCDVATALKRSMRQQDTVARIGGDEFCVLAPETDESGARRLAARTAQAVAEVTVGVETLRTSLGFSVFPGDGVTTTALLHEADQRLLGAKRTQQGGRAYQRVA
jgi:diguanylate cyclase (GGDEF)-like protein